LPANDTPATWEKLWFHLLLDEFALDYSLYSYLGNTQPKYPLLKMEWKDATHDLKGVTFVGGSSVIANVIGGFYCIVTPIVAIGTSYYRYTLEMKWRREAREKEEQGLWDEKADIMTKASMAEGEPVSLLASLDLSPLYPPHL
jgi:hypothetical protein